jgi:hypothetical protein
MADLMTVTVFYVSLLSMYMVAAAIAYSLVIAIIRLHDHLQASKPRPMATRNKGVSS